MCPPSSFLASGVLNSSNMALVQPATKGSRKNDITDLAP